MSYNHTFHWPAGPNDVIVTGTFDNWSASLPLVKTSKGDFELTFPFSAEQQNDDKIVFKFVVDGVWTTSNEYEIVSHDGNENNVLHLEDLKTASKASTGVKIPEAAGLESVVPTKKDLNTTVLPSTEGQQVTLGEPGVVIPTNAHEIKEFGEVRDVDAKALNEKLNAEEAKVEDKVDEVKAEIPSVETPAVEEKAKEIVEDKVEKPAEELKTAVLPSTEGQQVTLGETGAVIPENSNEIKEFGEIRDVDAKDLNEKLNAEEADVEKKTKQVKVKKVIKRNKQTGEETVVSSDVIFDDEETNGVKTLDPKKLGEASDESAAVPTSAGTATTEATTVPEVAAPAAATKPAAETPKKPAAKKPVVKKPVKKAAAPAEKKEKKGFFSKIKKIFD